MAVEGKEERTGAPGRHEDREAAVVEVGDHLGSQGGRLVLSTADLRPAVGAGIQVDGSRCRSTAERVESQAGAGGNRIEGASTSLPSLDCRPASLSLSMVPS